MYIMPAPPVKNSKPAPVSAPEVPVQKAAGGKKVAPAAPVVAAPVVAAPVAAAPVQKGAAAKKVAAPVPEAKVAAPAAPAAPAQKGGKKAAPESKVAAPKAAAKAAPAQKAAAPKAKKAAAPKAKKAEADEEEGEDDAKGVRSFKVQLPGTEDYSGRFTGLTPYQAANKALSKYFRENKTAKSEISFSIRESTRGSKRSTYTYNGKREKLAIPVKYSIKSNDGVPREIVKEYKNRLTKVKKSDTAKEATA
jgi:hypothetical protein